MNSVMPPKHSTGMEVGHFAYAGQPMSADEVRERYRRKGLCVTCGRVQTHVRSKFGLHMEPVTRDGESFEGHCLKCHTMADILERLSSAHSEHGKPHKRSSGYGASAVTTHYGTERAGYNAGKREWLLGDETGHSGRSSATAKPRPPKHHKGSSMDDNTPTSASTNTTIQTAPSTDTAATMDTCSSLRDVASILAGMRANPENAEVQRAGCAELCKHAACSSPSSVSLHAKRQKREEMMEAVDVVVTGMKRHLSDIDVQKRGCHALFRFTSNMATTKASSHSSSDSYDANGNLAIDAELCRSVVRQGGVTAVVSAMEAHLESRSVQREAMRVLRNGLRATSNHSTHRTGKSPPREAPVRVLQQREVRAIVNAMERYAQVLTVQRIATDTLKIAAMSKHNWEELRNEENVERLKMALREAARNFQKECESAVWAVLKVIRVPGTASRNASGGSSGSRGERGNQKQVQTQANVQTQQVQPQAKVQNQPAARACPRSQSSDVSEVDSLSEEVESRVKINDKKNKGKKSKRWRFMGSKEKTEK